MSGVGDPFHALDSNLDGNNRLQGVNSGWHSTKSDRHGKYPAPGVVKGRKSAAYFQTVAA